MLLAAQINGNFSSIELNVYLVTLICMVYANSLRNMQLHPKVIAKFMSAR
jgi:hypothetical protein